MAESSDKPFTDASSAVLAQDACMKDGFLDRAAWRRTLFMPVSPITEGRSHVIEDEEQLDAMLQELEDYGLKRGITRIQTRILSHIEVSDNVATITGFRDQWAENERVGTTSLTLTVIKAGDGWRINQIHFNDARADMSAMTQILRQSGED